jgi:hypothetical protein
MAERHADPRVRHHAVVEVQVRPADRRQRHPYDRVVGVLDGRHLLLFHANAVRPPVHHCAHVRLPSAASRRLAARRRSRTGGRWPMYPSCSRANCCWHAARLRNVRPRDGYTGYESMSRTSPTLGSWVPDCEPSPGGGRSRREQTVRKGDRDVGGDAQGACGPRAGRTAERSARPAAGRSSSSPSCYRFPSPPASLTSTTSRSASTT